jgi:serine/threonine-protein kinase
MDRLADAMSVPPLPERYTVRGRLGEGGMGVVWLAEDQDLGRTVAIKVARDSRSGGLAERLAREARTIARLEHPGVVPIHGTGRLPDGRAYYVMKHVRGETLSAWAADRPRDLRESLRTLLRLCDVLAFAHERGVVHRDLKPDNVMVGPFGELFVMDWGLARLRGVTPAEPGIEEAPSEEATGHGTVMGTPGYMAPEQERGAEEIGPPADVFALGGVLRFLVQGPAPEGATRRLPRRLRAILVKARAPREGDRYANAKDLSLDLVRFIDGRPVSAYREKPWERIGRWLSRNSFLAWLVAAYLLIRILVFFLAQ